MSKNSYSNLLIIFIFSGGCAVTARISSDKPKGLFLFFCFSLYYNCESILSNYFFEEILFSGSSVNLLGSAISTSLFSFYSS